ncbi:hypothetical protein LCGC14_0716150 [marine sediment metagenome]|uniref:HTH cro/C1-type domain-containing protein n=1 Tax=marine sediment metagenome TaxID=412755 RepID=A0A0F9SZ82_9ZZZZ
MTNGPKPFLRMTNRLRELRLGGEKTQNAIAEELEMPRGSYSLLESGIALPDKTMLNSLTHVFKCKAVEIYAGIYLDIISMES